MGTGGIYKKVGIASSHYPIGRFLSSNIDMIYQYTPTGRSKCWCLGFSSSFTHKWNRESGSRVLVLPKQKFWFQF